MISNKNLRLGIFVLTSLLVIALGYNLLNQQNRSNNSQQIVVPETQTEIIRNPNDHAFFMNEAVKLAIKGMNANEGGPFGCVIVKDGKIVGRGNNKVTSTNDPTAHAEVVAIRDACHNLNSFQLDGCILYTSCEPCPMCFGAIYWARPLKVYYGAGQEDAADIGFDDQFIYEEIELPYLSRSIPFEQLQREIALRPFELWSNKAVKTEY